MNKEEEITNIQFIGVIMFMMFIIGGILIYIYILYCFINMGFYLISIFMILTVFGIVGGLLLDNGNNNEL